MHNNYSTTDPNQNSNETIQWNARYQMSQNAVLLLLPAKEIDLSLPDNVAAILIYYRQIIYRHIDLHVYEIGLK